MHNDIEHLVAALGKKVAGVLILGPSDAIHVIEECRRRECELLGIDAFFVREGGRLQPSIEDSVDLSTPRNRLAFPDPYSAAANVVRAAATKELFFEVVFGDELLEPDFYLASTEGYGMERPRKCWTIGRVSSSKRDDLMLIRISPPLRCFVDGNHVDIGRVIIATRHKGASLFPIAEWPVYVHVTIPNASGADDYKSIAWAELYRTDEDARTKRI